MLACTALYQIQKGIKQIHIWRKDDCCRRVTHKVSQSFSCWPLNNSRGWPRKKIDGKKLGWYLTASLASVIRLRSSTLMFVLLQRDGLSIREHKRVCSFKVTKLWLERKTNSRHFVFLFSSRSQCRSLAHFRFRPLTLNCLRYFAFATAVAFTTSSNSRESEFSLIFCDLQLDLCTDKCLYTILEVLCLFHFSRHIKLQSIESKR